MLMRKIRLTREQESRLPAVCEKWRRIVLATHPSNRKRAERAVLEIYRRAGAPTKPKLIWLDNPLEYTDRVKKCLTFGPQSGPRSWAWSLSLRRDVAHLGATRYYKESLVNEIEAAIAREVPGLPPVLRFDDSIWTPTVYGYSTARDFALMDFLNTPRHQRFAPFMTATASCHAFVLSERAAILFERPLKIHLDAAGRLHNYDGPAVEYRGAPPGEKIIRSRFHGVAIDSKWLRTPADQITIDDVMKEQNAEVRSALIGKIGFERLLKTARYRTVSQHHGNRLIEFKFAGQQWRSKEHPRIDTLRFRALHLKWRGKTGDRETMLPVPRTLGQFGADRPANVNDCEQVRRWTLGWPKEALAVAET
jgi:hypothetical protein